MLYTKIFSFNQAYYRRPRPATVGTTGLQTWLFNIKWPNQAHGKADCDAYGAVIYPILVF